MKGWIREVLRGRGDVGVPVLVAMALVIVVALAGIIPALSGLNTNNAISKLTGQGYVVLAAGEYAAIMALLTNTHDDATTAAAAAALAASNAQTTLNLLRLHTENENFLFPDTTAYNITLSAPGTANTWSAWTEIVASNAITLSSKFAASSGYLSQVTLYGYNFADELVVIEIAYDDDGTDVVGRVMARSDFTWVLELNSEPIPAGSTIYYRMMSSHINESIKANFKYYYD